MMLEAGNNLAGNQDNNACRATSDKDTWQFEIGMCVSHRDQPMPSLVMARCKSGKGLELYGVRSFAAVDPQRDRLILGSCLKVPDNDDCAECLLNQTGLCPRRL